MQRAEPNTVDGRIVLAAQVLACGALAFAGYFPVNNPDTFGHLAQGRQIAQLGHVPRYDTFSFFRPEPALWRNYEWLSDLLTYRLYALGGPDALIAAKCLMLALSAFLLVKLAERFAGVRGALVAAVLLIVAIPAARFRLTERPHLLALPLAALYFHGLSQLLGAFGRARRSVDAAVIAALSLLHLAWVNLHGSHLLGLAITSVFLVLGFREREPRGRLLAVLGLQLLASCVSPYGPAILVDAVAHVADPVYRKLVTEWEAWKETDPVWLFAAPIAHTLLLAAVAPRLVRKGPPVRALLAAVCMLGLASFRSIRFVAEYLLLGAPLLALGLSTWLERVAVRRLAVGLLCVVLLASPLLAWGAAELPPYLAPGRGESTRRLPAAAGHYLATHARAPRVLAAIEDSWFLMFAVPQARFLVDGRVPFYGPAHLTRVRYALEHPEALVRLLVEHRIDTVVVRHTFAAQRVLFGVIRAHPEFRLVSVEDRYATYVRHDLALKDGSAPRALALDPSYDPAWLLSADPEAARRIVAELARLPDEENSRGYRGFVRAMLALAPLFRPGHDDGLRAPEGAQEVATLRSAERQLARASEGADGVPVVDAYHALVATALCDFDTALAAFELARREGESRQTLLGLQELRLRRGETAEVQRFLQEAERHPGAAGDGWLAALRAAVHAPPRCP